MTLTVLVVDDDDATRMLVRDVVAQELAADVVDLPDGYEAIQWLGANRADLVLLDLAMPRVDGLGVLRWVQRRGLAHRMPIVAFTATGMPGVRDLLARGADHAIEKPFDVEELLTIIRDVLKR